MRGFAAREAMKKKEQAAAAAVKRSTDRIRYVFFAINICTLEMLLAACLPATASRYANDLVP